MKIIKVEFLIYIFHINNQYASLYHIVHNHIIIRINICKIPFAINPYIFMSIQNHMKKKYRLYRIVYIVNCAQYFLHLIRKRMAECMCDSVVSIYCKCAYGLEKTVHRTHSLSLSSQHTCRHLLSTHGNFRQDACMHQCITERNATCKRYSHCLCELYHLTYVCDSINGGVSFYYAERIYECVENSVLTSGNDDIFADEFAKIKFLMNWKDF